MAIRRMTVAAPYRGSRGRSSTYDNQMHSKTKNYSVVSAFEVTLNSNFGKPTLLKFDKNDIVVIETRDDGAVFLWPWSPHDLNPITKYWLRGAERTTVMDNIKP